MVELQLKRLVSVIALASFAALGLGVPSNGLAVSDEPSTGMVALQECLQKPGSSLNVLYLMDISTSMHEDSDPDEKRKEMMSSTLEMFNELGAVGDYPTFFDFVTFGKGGTSDNREAQSWKRLSSENLSASQDQVEELASNAKAVGQGTDWTGGLQLAQQVLKQRLKREPNSCFVMLWMTDGMIDPNGTGSTDVVPNPDDIESVHAICNQGLINWFRKTSSNTLILGALLDKNKGAKDLNVKKKSISIFRAVVEGSGPIGEDVATAYHLSNQGEYVCGSKDEPYLNLGKMVTAADPSDLTWNFVNLVALARNLALLPVSKTGEIKVVPSAGVIEIYAKGNGASSKPSLTDASGNDVCKLFPESCKWTSSSGNWRLVVQLPESGLVYGDWATLPRPSKSIPVKAFVGTQGDFKSLMLSADLSEDELQGLSEGQQQPVTFTIKDRVSKRPIPASDFESIEICITNPISGVENRCSKPNVNSALFATAFTPVASDNKLSSRASIKLKGTDQRISISNTWGIKVQESSQVGRIVCPGSPKKDVCLLGSIPNAEKPLEAVLDVTIEDGSSTVSLKNGTIADQDEELSRTGHYVLDSQDKISVKAGETKQITFRLSNDHLKISKGCNIRGTIEYQVELDGGKILPGHKEVEWCVKHETNVVWVILVYLLLVVIGVGVPYLLLLARTRSAARLLVEEFRWATVPAIISNDGLLQGIEIDDEGESTASAKLTAPHRNQLSGRIEVKDNAREIQIDGAQVKVSPVGLNAFAKISVSLEWSGRLIVSNRGSLAGNLCLTKSTADQVLNGFAFFVGDDSQLAPVQIDDNEDASADSSFDSEPNLSIDKKKLTAATRELEGVVYFVVLGDQEPNKALSRIEQALNESSYKTPVEQLAVLREQELKIAQEKLTSSVEMSSKVENEFEGAVATHLQDDFDDFDGLGTSNKSESINFVDKFDEDF